MQSINRGVRDKKSVLPNDETILFNRLPRRVSPVISLLPCAVLSVKSYLQEARPGDSGR